MDELIECEKCPEFAFTKCGLYFPCEKLISEINVIGIAYKPNNKNDPVTKNSEAKFIPFSISNPEKFYYSAFNLAKKTKLTPVTTSEFFVLARQLKDENFKILNFKKSDSDYILVTENWAHEIRTLLKFILRLHTLDFDMPFHYIESVAKKVDPLVPLSYDKRKSLSSYFSELNNIINLGPKFAFTRKLAKFDAPESPEDLLPIANNNLKVGFKD